MFKVCIHYTVSGWVQGVWYRSETQQEAKKLKLTGWVKNVENGNVEVLVCGEQQQITRFEKWLRQGPKLARVKSVISKKLPWQQHEDFIIMYQ
jgi:acylphosphatase